MSLDLRQYGILDDTDRHDRLHVQNVLVTKGNYHQNHVNRMERPIL